MRKLRAIDLFAGAGGFSTGAVGAGAEVIWAANHWKSAVEIHAANHPETAHACQDLHQADWTQVPRHDLMLASPACQGHSKARGKERAHHDATRSTAMAILGAADFHRPRFILVENVVDFLDWDGYRGWKTMLRDFGYTLTENILNAADFGVPQSRERLFIMATRDGALKLSHPGRAHKAASTIIDWDYPRWNPIDKPGRAASTLEQIRNGRALYGNRFLVAYYGSEDNGRDLAKPIGTITTRDRFAVVDGDKMRMLSAVETRKAMGFPSDYILPTQHKLAIHMLGNAVCPPVAKSLVAQIQAAA